MNIENYMLKDFLMDESFYNWVKQPNGGGAQFWETWLRNHPEKKIEVSEAKKIIMSISFKDKSFSKDEITTLWDKIKEDSIEQKTFVNRSTVKSTHTSVWKYLKVAAVIFPFIVASVLFLFYPESPNEENEVTQQLIGKHIPKGQKLTVFLPDGSKVKLNAESTISYLKPFDSNQRIVQLDGEAFFEVTPDKSRPFIVKSGCIDTKVLGTSFNIKAYPEDKRVLVAVKSGTVSVENKNQDLPNKLNKSIVLSPKEMATYSEKTNQTIVSAYDPMEVLGWSDGVLYFDDASMDEFISKLERWYGIDIIVRRKKPISKGIVGVFTNQSLEEILMGTKDASEFEYEFLANGKVLIK